MYDIFNSPAWNFRPTLWYGQGIDGGRVISYTVDLHRCATWQMWEKRWFRRFSYCLYWARSLRLYTSNSSALLYLLSVEILLGLWFGFVTWPKTCSKNKNLSFSFGNVLKLSSSALIVYFIRLSDIFSTSISSCSFVLLVFLVFRRPNTFSF